MQIKKLLTNKSFLTNKIACDFIIIGYLLSYFYPNTIKIAELIKTTGYFALSGSITNWIAIHMLFEKVPFLYGSGVIMNKFEKFKESIKNMILNEFFSEENINKFLDKLSKSENHSPNDMSKFIDSDKIFLEIKSAIMESQFGGMLNMFGGEAVLEPLKTPIKNKINSIARDILSGSQDNKDKNINIKYTIRQQVDSIVTNRVEELTAKDIKIMVQNIIKEHLGWLVVWGGVFGGLIGVLFGLF